MTQQRTPIGTIIQGSLNEGLVMRINSGTSLESLKTGKFVSIIGHEYTFFSMITDLTLAVTNQEVVLYPPREQDKLLQEIVREKCMYATAQLRPLIMLDKAHRINPVKTIPHHFSPVFDATEQDICHIFGDEKDLSRSYFTIGKPLDMQTPVCINLEHLSERSVGIFGKTGTGKTFITRLVLAGLIHSKKAVNLIFDMHSEYGLQARKEGSHLNFVKGLKTLFPDKVAIFSIDPASTRRRGASADVELTFNYQDIQVEDIISLGEELNLHTTALEAAYLIAARYKKDWLQALLEQDDVKTFATNLGAHPESVAALYRKLKRIERFSFFKPIQAGTMPAASSVIDQMMEYLDKGINVCVEFGNYTSSFCYLLIANIITRRIHSEYITKTEKFLGSQRKEDEPIKLIITIEEAHKFLNPIAARQTIFGTIAREMRKYYVSLLVVDQRPSGIDPEIISQLGTKIVAQLNDEKDIQTVMTGISNAHTLRGILASLDTKKQVLVMGHAVTIPVVVQTREYDEVFYKDMSSNTKPIDELIKELF